MFLQAIIQRPQKKKNWFSQNVEDFLNILDFYTRLHNAWAGNIDHSPTLPLNVMEHAQEMQYKSVLS